MKKPIIFISFFLIIIILGRNLNPFSSYFFTFHDETQPARIQQFVKELKNFHIPPRVAPDMNFGIGYPIFNFYAPTAYWITSFFHLLGLGIIDSLKISFLIAILIAFFGMYLFLNLYFDFFSSLLGGFFYITSLYFPLNIFVRGNLAELWFLALFPISIYFIVKSEKEKNIDKKIFLTKTIILFFLLTTHNIYSLISIPLIVVLIFITKNNFKTNLLSLIFAIFFSAYFWLPATFELKNTWATEVASLTNYKDHFLCFSQLWQSNWGYGGSAPGCDHDGMSFKIGKIQLTFFLLGGLLFLVNLIRKRNYYRNKLSLFIIIYSLLFLFLTTYQSSFIWTTLEHVLKIIQFPWRLIGPSLFGIAYFSSYFFDRVRLPFKNFLVIFFIFLVLIVNQKYFAGQKISNKEFERKYLSKEYIKNKVAFKAAEYLPKTNDYQYWRTLEKKEPTKEEINKLTLKPFLKNSQTTVQRIGNFITLITFLIIFFILRTK